MPADGDKHFDIPYDVPHLQDQDDRRSSVSSASSSSHINDDRMTVPYRDEANKQDGLEMQQIPLRYQNGTSNGDRKMKEGLSFDEGEAEDLLDEEERVGLMMKSKYSKRDASGSSYCLRCIPDRLVPLAILVAVTLAIALLAPILGWLASANRLSALHYKPEHLTEIIIPSHWTLPNQPSKASHFRKIKHPLPSGVTKLDTFAAPFSMDFVLDDASTQSNSTSLLPITLDNVLDGTFNAASRSLRWCPEDQDEGVFLQESSSGDLVLEDVTHLRKDMTGQGSVAKGGGKVLYVRAQDVQDPATGRPINYSTFSISPDMQFVLFFSHRKKQWRYSSFSKIWIHNVGTKTTTQIGFNKTDPNVATAQWSTKGLRVSFVEDNNLYVIKDANKPDAVIKISTTGDKDVFNGVPDWVYEEEVLGDDVAHWWSPDGDKLAYFELDEAAVKTYSFPIYNPTETNGKALLYPQSVNMKYPKPGTPNPIISVWVYDVNTGVKSELISPPSHKSGAKSVEDIAVDSALRAAGTAVLVTELNWMNANTVMIRETNRVSDAMRIMAFNTKEAKTSSDGKESTIEGVITRRVSTATSGGWIPVDQDIKVIDKKDASTAYVDIVAVHKGYRHIAYFESAFQSQPKFLTKGSWEVDKILFVGNGKVYFTAAYPKPAYRHILSVDLPKDAASAQATDSPTPLTDISKPGFYSASFDPKGSYYVLDNQGPSLPSSKVLSLRDTSFGLVLEDNSKLYNTMGKYVRPQIAYYNITTHDGTPISVVEMRPHDFDASGHTRYPALIYVYEGPNSQQVQATFRMGTWQTYLACSLGYLVITMDGRGTGFQGREYRDTVTWRLGEMESHDIIEGAQAIRRLPYIAQSKIGVWGWSYGGYLTAKIVEKNSGAFDLAMSVAPVTRWEFYDTIYTERYMKTPHLNKGGYENSSIHITDGYRKTKYLLAAGTGDDNVHFQNSVHMLDMLQGAKIRDYWFEAFPDSSHSISMRGANRELYDYLTRFLVYNWGAGGKRLLRYKDDKDLSTVL